MIGIQLSYLCLLLLSCTCVALNLRDSEIGADIGETQPWLLPVFPNRHPSTHLPVSLQNSTVDGSQHTEKDDRSKLIPRHLWIALRDKDEEYVCVCVYIYMYVCGREGG